MVGAAIDLYCDAFVARRRHELDSHPVVQVAPGVRGVASIRLLVFDDSGHDRLVAEVAGPWRGVVLAFERASRCQAFLRDQPGWSASHAEMAMVLRDIQAATGAALPDGLEIRPVNRTGLEGPDAIPLKEAAVAASTADPGITDTADEVARFLSGLPPSVRLFAAIDEQGVARATSACHVFGDYSQIFFVSTDPAWRRRGIGQAMTLAALRAAASLGARSAILHATEDGLSIYKRLGFEEAGMLTRFWYANKGDES